MWSRKAVSTIAATASCLMYERECGAQEHARQNMCPYGRSSARSRVHRDRSCWAENARKSSRLPRHSAASAAFVLLPLLRVALQDDKKTHENTHEVHKQFQGMRHKIAPARVRILQQHNINQSV